MIAETVRGKSFPVVYSTTNPTLNVFSASGSRTYKGPRRASLANRRFFYAHMGLLRIFRRLALVSAT